MTIPELQAKRDEILQRVDVAKTQFGDRSVEYADAQKSLALIDNEIARQQAVAAGQSGTIKTSFVRHSKGF
jgi:hypothetical protein